MPPQYSMHIVQPVHPPDEAFTAKHMPDLGHDVHDSQLFHWKLNRWRRLERELTSPEFGCGGYKWYVLPGYCRLSHSCNLKPHSGGYFFSHPAIITLPRTTPSLSISIVPTPTQRRVGTLLLNSRWLSQILTIQPSTPSAVRHSQFKTFSLNF